jgi:hypothetical protein
MDREWLGGVRIRRVLGFVEAGPPKLVWFLPTLGFRVGAGLVHIHGGRYSHL